ncbi:DNA modification methylase [Leucobacter sp. OH2974_COT-288]|uniref:DNA modification methylase n=1 Tax=Canibacter oris TaxID=1365628 RepID=A0A840DLL7_9MICO|nr:DNA modification methylase [Canibacter oris]MBB4070978.1 hypothetical protein [Canibacter oris]RRD36504.1 DNA modification methylase [Leucobacter sp. OH2974_COT-288]
MKSRTTKSIALAGVLALSLSGCALLAPVATQHPYDPSDGVGADVSHVDVRNLLLIADKPGGTYNVVFTAVNEAEATELDMTFVAANGKKESVSFDLQPGSTKVGDLTNLQTRKLLQLGNQEIGSTVTTYLTVEGENVEVYVPVLDGTLEEYKQYVPTAADTAITQN